MSKKVKIIIIISIALIIIGICIWVSKKNEKKAPVSEPGKVNPVVKPKPIGSSLKL